MVETARKIDDEQQALRAAERKKRLRAEKSKRSGDIRMLERTGERVKITKE